VALLAALLGGGCGGRVEVPSPSTAGLEAPVAARFAEARAAVMREPRAAAAWGRYGMVLEAHERAEDAAACYAEAARLDPREPRWPYMQAMALAPVRPEEAVACFEQSVVRDPRSALIRQEFGDTLLQLGRTEEAITQHRAALEIDPNARRAILALAGEALRRGDDDEALRLLTRASELQFFDREVHAQLAVVYRLRGETERAERERLLSSAYPPAHQPDPFRDPIVHEQASAQSMIERAHALMRAGRAEDAERALRAALAQRPDLAAIHSNLGAVLTSRGRYEEAEQVFEEASRRWPDDAALHGNYARLLAERGRGDLALARFEHALRINPNDPQARFNYGITLQMQGREPDAEAAYRAALEIDPVLAPAHNALAEMLAARGDTEGAIRHWRDAMDFNRADPEAALALAETLSNRGAYAEAIATLHYGLKHSPGHARLIAAIVALRATCPEGAHRNGIEAVRLARRLVETGGPADAGSLGLLGAALAESGQFAEAAAATERALVLARSNRQHSLVESLSAQLSLFRAGQPLRQASRQQAPGR
jgi:tetratricopeptide (TPR) repeat protein